MLVGRLPVDPAIETVHADWILLPVEDSYAVIERTYPSYGAAKNDDPMTIEVFASSALIHQGQFKAGTCQIACSSNERSTSIAAD